MTDKQVSELTAAGALSGAELFHLVQSGTSKKVTLQTIIDYLAYQPSDADLTAIAALGSTGFPARTAANTWALRSIAGGTYVTVTNPAGVAGNPSIAVDQTEAIVIPVTAETEVVLAGTGKRTFRMPYAFTVSAVRASLTTAQASGNILTIDINETLTSILSTKLTIDNTEKTSTTAATAAVLSDTALANDAEITIDVDQIGNGTAAGLKVYLIGTRT